LPLPEDETSRLEVLKSLRILDTPPERIFDDLARLTSYICGTPIAFIGFMDANRLWFKSRIGWDVAEVPRDMSFCAHTILQSDVLVVSDTLADSGRLADCALATHGGVRFYAGVSLMSGDGHALGTLAAMDSIPRGLTMGQTEALRRLARTVVSLIESRCASDQSLAFSSIQQPIASVGGEHRVQGFSFWRDMSEQRRAHEALRHSERRLEGIIHSAMDAIITVDNDQRIVVFNKAAEEIFCCPASEALGQHLEKFIPERFRTAHRQHIHNFGAMGVTTRSMYSPATLYAIRTNGEEFPIEATISQIESDGKKLFTVIVRDIGARLRMEAELRQGQKAEAVGQLAGGIAHEFNNFLGVILGYSELLSEEAAVNSKLAQYVKDIRSATQHATSLTRQLLAFSRKQVLEPKVLDINQCVWESHNLLRRLVPANVEVVPALGAKIGRVKADPGQIQQILMNLVLNARDAMPQGGRVVIETADAELDQQSASQHVGLKPGEYVLLSVTDTGLGMNERTRSRLFEPFFTTKEPGKGTGLGLSTVYGIVKHSGGHIEVQSETEKGTTFHIYLPRSAEQISVVENVHANEQPQPQTNPATILVVEDESALRRLICTSLERRNHNVLSAKDGAEGLALFRQNAAVIQIVVTDLMMPRMDGLELKQQISSLKPNIKFLFMSGYAEQVLEQHHGFLNGCAFLEKPFLPKELAERVDKLLGGEAAA
jgi:two-component system, cell cycle sensor histidine kinase and response regulator CckA